MSTESELRSVTSLLTRTIGGSDVLDEMKNTERSMQLLELARQFVPLVLADGTLADRDGCAWRLVIGFLADASGEIAKAEREKRHSIEAIERLLPESADLDETLSSLDELPYAYLFAHGRAAYLLGLVVGQQLGPDAFRTGGAR